MLDPTLSRQRQQRLLPLLHQHKLDAIVVGDPQHVYYLSAFRPHVLHFAGFILFADGRSLLVSPNDPAPGTAADKAIAYEANAFSTLRQEQPELVAQHLAQALADDSSHAIGIDFMRAYQSVHWLPNEYHTVRKHVYQLYELVNHFQLFGAEYLKPLMACVEKVGQFV